MRTIALLLAMAAAAHAQPAKADKDCLFCHEDQGAEWKKSVHAGASVGCTSCHGTDELAGGAHRYEPTFKPSRLPQVARDCGACHEAVLAAYLPSDHAMTVARGGETPPLRSTCSACHGYHDVPKAERRAILKHCLECHGKESGDYRLAEGAFARLDEFEGGLARLAARVADYSGRPGIATRDAAEQLQATRDAIAEARTAQHGLEFTSVAETAGRSAVAADASYNRLAERDRDFARSRAAVIPFLVLVVASMVLSALKFRRSGGPS